MHLEDHAGDIIHKARDMSKASASDAARAAGLTEDELQELEKSGKAAKKPNCGALAGLIGLSAGKLEAILGGWTPAEKDLSAWRELRRVSTSDGDMSVNAYLIWDEVSREAALFDTGWDAREIIELIAANQLQLRHLFITHSHEDHIAAVDEVRKNFPKIRVHSSAASAPVDQRNRPNDFIQLGSLRITNRDTPGHAADGTTYVIGNWAEDAPYVAVVGDAIFAGSIGRGNQSWDLAKQKVRERIFSLPPETLICPGHGPFTTVAEELAHNPFF
jgi:hydroxyacylglutathione hydrolase